MRLEFVIVVVQDPLETFFELWAETFAYGVSSEICNIRKNGLLSLVVELLENHYRAGYLIESLRL